MVFEDANTRASATHIFFWGGILSNWYTAGPNFSGERCFELLVPELDKASVAHPLLDTFATRLLKDHMFNCGEQWMMVMKGWFFETDLELGNWIVGPEDERLFQDLKAKMYLAKVPQEWPSGSKERAMWQSTICQVLRMKNPRQQKALGRRARNFDNDVWTAVSVVAVTAACVARAQADASLRKIYLSSKNRQFVEGSPTDTIWGVGIHWKASEIENPALWMGENRLGKCHDEAAVVIRGLFNDGSFGFNSNVRNTE